MRSYTLTAAMFLIAAAFGAHSASAWQIDNASGNSRDGSSRFDDPDDKIPFPHIGDDGQPAANFQSQQPVGNSGLSFSLTPSNAEPDAFRRAEQRMQQ